MKMSELIIACDEDKLEFQNLDQCAKSLHYDHKKGTTVTFVTSVNLRPDIGTVKLGLVVWLDREAVKAAIAKEKEAAA